LSILSQTSQSHSDTCKSAALDSKPQTLEIYQHNKLSSHTATRHHSSHQQSVQLCTKWKLDLWNNRSKNNTFQCILRSVGNAGWGWRFHTPPPSLCLQTLIFVLKNGFMFQLLYKIANISTSDPTPAPSSFRLILTLMPGFNNSGYPEFLKPGLNVGYEQV